MYTNTTFEAIIEAFNLSDIASAIRTLVCSAAL